METPPGEQTRRFSSLGCGCGSVMVVVLVGLMVMAWLTYIQGRRFEKTMADPEARAALSREILGYEDLPDGYYPMGGFSTLFGTEMAMLSDRNPGPGEAVEGADDAFDERGFVFMKSRADAERRRELDELFAGERSESKFFAETDLTFAAEERLGRGVIEVPPAEVAWIAERGGMTLGGVTRDELLARLLVRCPGDERRLRVALWFEPAPEDEEWAGGPADPEAIGELLGHFDLCR